MSKELLQQAKEEIAKEIEFTNWAHLCDNVNFTHSTAIIIDQVSERYAQLLEQSKWISVEERLPEIDHEDDDNADYNSFLVYAPNSGILKAKYFPSERYTWLISLSTGIREFEPTHWQPLPEIPK